MSRLFMMLFLLLITSAVSSAADGPRKGDIDPKTGKVIKYWVAPMDPTYIRDEPGKSPMGMDLVPVYEEEGGEKEPSSTIRIDPVTMQNMGVRTARVTKARVARSIRALGTVTYDETRLYAVNLKFDGWVEDLHVDFVGESVTKGQPLFTIYSPEIVTAQEEYLVALRQMRELADSPYPALRNNARQLVAAAKKRLIYWDIEHDQVAEIGKTGKVRRAITVFSPADGVVTKKAVLAGQFIKAGMNQYEIADLSTVWVDVEVYEYELPYVRRDMEVEMELSYLAGKTFTGRVLFIYPYLDPQTRTARLRLAFDNREGILKPDMYGNVFLESVIEQEAIVVPQEAVIDSGVRKVVFVAKGKGRFEPREVTLGIESENHTFHVLDGLREHEEVVVSAQFMFDSESRLREAIQKMIEARSGGNKELSADDLDMDKMMMDDDLDEIGELQMDQ